MSTGDSNWPQLLGYDAEGRHRIFPERSNLWGKSNEPAVGYLEVRVRRARILESEDQQFKKFNFNFAFLLLAIGVMRVQRKLKYGEPPASVDLLCRKSVC